MSTLLRKLLRLSEVLEITGLSRSYVYARMKVDFPRPIAIGRARRWDAEEVQNFIEARIVERDRLPAK